ncbi:hypothetical protein L917_09014 [Phytophthora nicotianae]|uniref:Uncharacterized protein n=1 Tax=Phytophthora nicotianae TaxID=4792 RepID=W2L5T3_PHYNI|nr:hypothetical protein L917_09014 [Phytophthora nicotianae]
MLKLLHNVRYGSRCRVIERFFRGEYLAVFRDGQKHIYFSRRWIIGGADVYVRLSEAPASLQTTQRPRPQTPPRPVSPPAAIFDILPDSYDNYEIPDAFHEPHDIASQRHHGINVYNE